MPQLQINQGPQDALLYDNSRSYFTNVGYVRTSNFQMELRDVDPQNNAKLGSTVQFVIPKAADLLGPVDLMLSMEAAPTGASGTSAAFVKNFGFACIEQITFSVGSHDVEKIWGGDQLNIINELMRDDESRYTTIIGNDGAAVSGMSATALTNSNNTPAAAQSFIIPLGLFFTKHPSQYFPLAAIAGCNDVRISIKFRPRAELIKTDATATSLPASGCDIASAGCQLRCHYVHVTGPEATTLMNKEHVRLMKVWQRQSATLLNGQNKVSVDLSFLHPVSELILILRKESNFAGSDASERDYFNYVSAMDKLKLTLNGQDRHPSLSEGISKKYLQERLMPMLHSNTSEAHIVSGVSDAQLGSLLGRKEIIVYPFSLNPEGSNPAGAVNFSKVSHAKLTVSLPDGVTASGDHVVDIFAVNYNWLQIKDGRALTSFA